MSRYVAIINKVNNLLTTVCLLLKWLQVNHKKGNAMIYKDRLLSLIASKTNLDAQELRREVIIRYFEILDDEGSQFIDEILKFQDNPKILAAIVIARLDETVKEVISDLESLEMTLEEESAENLRTRH